MHGANAFFSFLVPPPKKQDMDNAAVRPDAAALQVKFGVFTCDGGKCIQHAAPVGRVNQRNESVERAGSIDRR